MFILLNMHVPFFYSFLCSFLLWVPLYVTYIRYELCSKKGADFLILYKKISREQAEGQTERKHHEGHEVVDPHQALFLSTRPQRNNTLCWLVSDLPSKAPPMYRHQACVGYFPLSTGIWIGRDIFHYPQEEEGTFLHWGSWWMLCKNIELRQPITKQR